MAVTIFALVGGVAKREQVLTDKELKRFGLESMIGVETSSEVQRLTK